MRRKRSYRSLGTVSNGSVISSFPVTIMLGAFLAIGSAFSPDGEAAVLQVPSHYATIQEAIQAAAGGDQVLVAAGVYNETIDFLGKTIEVSSVDGPEVTTIDGGGAGSVVVFQSGETATSILAGFTVTGGTGTAVGGYGIVGGGILCVGASPVIRGNLIRDNLAEYGGGIGSVSSGGLVSVRNNEITNNRAERPSLGAGGGVYVDGSAALVEGNRIRGNAASRYGGGIACVFTDTVVIAENDLSDNHMTESQYWPGGGAIGCFESSGLGMFSNTMTGSTGSTLYLERCTDARVDGNSIREGGLLWPAVYVRSSEDISFVQNRILDNRYRGLDADDSQIRLVANVIAGNTVLGPGAGVFARNSLTEMRSNLIARNAGAVEGTGVGFAGGSVSMINDTIADNFAMRGGNDLTGVLLHYVDSAELVNCVVWGNRSDSSEITIRFSPTTILHCDIERGSGGNGNFAEDPLFVDSANLDYRLRLGSPCIDRGTNRSEHGDFPFDFEGDPRVVDGGAGAVADVGCDEVVPAVAARFGTTAGEEGALFDALLVNGSRGDPRRVVILPTRQALTVEMLAPPSGPDPAGFACYVWLDEPDSTTLTPQPFGLGVMTFPTFLAGGPDNLPVKTWNNLGRYRKLGHPDYKSSPAPSVLLHLGRGVATPVKVTLQGFIEDLGSSASGPASITNAVVLDIEN